MRNRYELRGLLGVGSYGRVWAAYDRVLKKLVAVKRINKLFSDLTDCKRILREICILNRLPNHNNIVKLLDCFIDEEQTIENFDTLYLVMDISDSDLRKILKQNVYLTEMHVLTLMYHLLCGILYLHSAGIYHRDLKPANCLVNQNCTVKICDLGLARTNQLTSHVVTRWYRAPELILLQPNYDEKIDVWSIGCIFGELLA
uniref:Mitogen-activated protein kinase n=1 Tax=Dermatophagoides pteronyssinus TaxID=6956 RepID=A0A6P6Y9T3_DERPT|nr:mitogen-activated protein kinase 4-like [Dermatophagoides pteronyssinus]